MGFLRLNLLKPFEYVKETKKEIQEEKWRIEPTIWREALIQKYYLRLENPFVSGGRDLNPQPFPWQGNILPLNYHRMSSQYNKRCIFPQDMIDSNI